MCVGKSMKELSIIHLMMILVGGILYQKNDHITVILLWHVLIMYADVYPWIFYYYFKNRWCAIPTTFPITTRRQSCNAIMVVLSNENLPKQIHTFSTSDKRILIPCFKNALVIWIFFYFDSITFDRLGQNLGNFFVGIFEQFVIRKKVFWYFLTFSSDCLGVDRC